MNAITRLSRGNPKGGSGKTMVAIILAGEFAKHGYSVALVDGSSMQQIQESSCQGSPPERSFLIQSFARPFPASPSPGRAYGETIA